MNRKGGKLFKQVSDDSFVVGDLMTNRNVVLRNMETNVLKKKSIPRDHLKKIHIENEMNTNMTENTNENDDAPMETDDNMTTSVNDITDDMTHNMMKNMTTNTHEIEEILNNTQTNNQMVFISEEEDMFLDDMNMLSPSLSPDVTIAKVTQSKGFIFNPLNLQSREEIGPRLLITDFKAIQFENIGNHLTGKARGIDHVRGDGNGYFQAISYYLSGSENYHSQVRETICDYINFLPERLSALILNENEKKNGYKYTQYTEMASWAPGQQKSKFWLQQSA